VKDAIFRNPEVLSLKIIRRGILTMRCFCSELYSCTYKRASFSVGSSYHRKRERESEWRREKRFWIIHQTKP